MRRRAKLVLGLVFAVTLIGSAVARAQDSSASTIYRLNQGSTYQQGCFPPCLCPISQAATVAGTLILTPGPNSGSFKTYTVTEVNWVVPFAGRELRVIGSGTYEVDATQQRLELDLQANGQPEQLFDSGVVARRASFPNIIATISLHGERCFDTVFVVNTSPVPSTQIHHYHLVSGSTFQRGCFPPCECALGPKEPLSGNFTLVDLPPNPLFRNFAVVHVDWEAVTPNAVPPIMVQGNGFYQVGGEVAVQQELSLELAVGGGPVTHFDSGLVVGGGSFPSIDATISINGMRCADTVMVVKAVR
jgi:hypothetical protein